MGLTRIRADQISDIDYKQAVRVLTLSNVTLSGGAPSQVDGVNLNFDDRILVAGQTTTSQNGIYYVATLGSGVNGTWLRTSDANATGEIAAGMIVMVTEGNTYADTSWKLITNNPIVIGVTGLIFAQNTGDSFGAINANGTAVVANTVTSTAIFNSGNNLVLTGNATSDTITFAVSDTPVFTTVSATGNISGNFFIGNGSQLTGLPAGYSNADVATYLASNSNVTITTTGNITTTANISGNYILGNGSQLTGLPAGYANANVVAYGQAGWAGNIIPAANATYSLGNATNQWASVYVGANTLYLGTTPISANNTSNILLVNGNAVVTTLSAGNIATAGYISATGNVTGNYFIGNGSLLTGVSVTGSLSWTTQANTAPSGINPGSFWYDSYSGVKYQYTNDGTSNVWVDQSFPTSFTTLAVTGNATIGGNLGVTGTITYGNISSPGFISGTGNVTGGNILTAGIMSSTGNAVHGNILTAGLMSATGNITGGNLSVGIGTITVGNIVNANGNAVGNIGSSSNYFNTIFATATTALYADLAEMYSADQAYIPGTVVEFGDPEEIRASQTSHSTSVAGIISTNPSYLMNAAQPGEYALPVALTGRVPCCVVGKIVKGDRLVASDIPGVATVLDIAKYQPSCIIGKALENYDSTEVGVIEVAVGRT